MRVGLTLAALVGVAAISACAEHVAPSSPLPPAEVPPVRELPAPPDLSCSAWGELCPVILPTYDGSGQVVHPDIVAFPEGFGGTTYWLAMTPYPGGNNAFENPSLLTNDALSAWITPPGARAPLVGRPPSGYHSDPDMLFNPATRELWYYFRTTADGRDQVSLMTSSNGSTWSEPRAVVSADGISLISPAVVRIADGRWVMWSVNAVNGGCRSKATTVEQRTSSDGIRWSAPTSVKWEQPGYVVWHLDVQYMATRREFWAVFAGYPVEAGCAADDLFFARSADGVQWETFPSPIVARGATELFQHSVYRSTFTYDAARDVIRLWISGARFGDQWVWRAATVQWRMPDLLARVSAPRPPTTTVAPEQRPRVPLVWDRSSRDAAISNFP
jgi:hypothetical protein